MATYRGTFRPVVLLIPILVFPSLVFPDVITFERHEALMKRPKNSMELVFSFTTRSRYRKAGRSVGRLSVSFDGEAEPRHCTAVVISDSHLLTALHCLENKYGFGFRKIVLSMEDVDPRLPLNELEPFDTSGDPFEVQHVIEESNQELDYAILKTVGTLPVEYPPIGMSDRTLQRKEELFVVHHPKAAPQHVTRRGCRIRFTRDAEQRVIHQCDTEDGSSGAPLFSDNDWCPKVVALHTEWDQIDVDKRRINKATPISLIAADSSIVSNLVSNQPDCSRFHVNEELLVERDEIVTN